MTGKERPAPEVIKSIAAKKMALDPALTKDHRAVWSHAGNTGYKDICTIKDEEIEMATGLTPERIDDILDDLQALGYLKREGFATRGGNPKVRLTVPWTPAAKQVKIDAWIKTQKAEGDATDPQSFNTNKKDGQEGV